MVFSDKQLLAIGGGAALLLFLSRKQLANAINVNNPNNAARGALDAVGVLSPIDQANARGFAVLDAVNPFISSERRRYARLVLKYGGDLTAATAAMVRGE